jgi:hypothetical protein
MEMRYDNSSSFKACSSLPVQDTNGVCLDVNKQWNTMQCKTRKQWTWELSGKFHPTYMQIPMNQPHSTSEDQETSRLLWNLKAHYHAHRTPPRGPVMSQRSPVHILTLGYSNKFELQNLTHAQASQMFSSLQFSRSKLCMHSRFSHACYITRPLHVHWFDFSNNISGLVQIMRLFIIQVSPASC